MTEHLESTGASVYAIEVGGQLVSRLQSLTKRFPNLTVIPGDVLEIDIAQLAAGRKLRIYGNLPYYITSPILHHLFASAELIEEIHVVIQLEMPLRLTAPPGTRGIGHISLLPHYFARP